MFSHEQKLAAEKVMREMTAAYAAARRLNGVAYKCEPVVDLGAVVKTQGSTQFSFPLPCDLPGSRSLGRAGLGLGLGVNITSPACRSIQYDSELKGYWLELTAKDKNKQVVSAFVLVSEDKNGADAIVLTLSPSQRAMFDAYRTALKQPNQVVILERPVALDDQIIPRGLTKDCFAIPGGRSLGREGAVRGLGLGMNLTSPACHSIQYDTELKGYWLELTAKDKNKQVVSSFVLVSEDKNGADAIVLTLSPSQRAMFDAYRTALKQPNQVVILERPVALDDQITHGATKGGFAIPGGHSLGREGANHGLGLGRNIVSPACRSIQYESSLKGYWLGLQAINQNGALVESYALVDEKAAGNHAIRLTLSPEQKAIFDAYQIARASDSAFTLNIELRRSIGAVNYAKPAWLKPSCQTIGKGKSLSLSQTRPLTSFTATQIHHLGSERFVIWTTAKYEGGGVQYVRLLSSNDGLEVIGQSESDSAQICKGYALDRYAAHLAAVARLPSAVANPSFKGSALTGENYIPNMQALETVIHAKWGKQPRDVFDYILSYGRMMRWHGLPVGCMLLADDTHHEALLAATTAAAKELRFILGISTVAQWAGAIMKDTPNIKGELDKLQVMADLGMEDELRRQSYSPTLTNMATGPTTPGVDWQTRIDALTTQDGYEVLIETLDKHIAVHSPYWEDPYHMQLAKCCSYLLENRGNLTHEQHETIRAKALALYPELSTYPDAWRTLDSEAARTMPRNERLELVKFDLTAALEALKAHRISAPPQSNDTQERGTGHVIEISELKNFVHRSNSVTRESLGEFLSEATALKAAHPEYTTLLANAALYALCKVLANDEKYWRASSKLAELKNGIRPIREDIAILREELSRHSPAVNLLELVEDLFSE